MPKDQIHFFNDIAYYHVPFTHCPTGEKLREELKCHCNPKDNFDWKGYSCRSLQTSIPRTLTNLVVGTSRYYDINGLKKPEGWEDQSQ